MEYGSTSYGMAQFLHAQPAMHATTLGLEFYQTSWLNITNKQLKSSSCTLLLNTHA